MKVIDKMDQVLAALGCICLFSVMWIVGVDAVGRNLLSNPLPGAYVLIEEYLMPAMIFPVISYTWMRNDHVGISLLRDRFPSWIQRALRAVDILLALTLFSIIAYVGWANLSDAYQKGLVTSGLIRWPIWLGLIAIPLGSIMFCARLLSELIVLVLRPGRLAGS